MGLVQKRTLQIACYPAQTGGSRAGVPILDIGVFSRGGLSAGARADRVSVDAASTRCR